MKKLLVCNNVCKKIGNKDILKNISFTINKGDIMAFIGPNGSGKTTTIKLMLDLQNITSGDIYINGFDLKKHFTKAIERVGAIVENPDFYMYLTGMQNLKLYNSYYRKYIDDNKLMYLIKLVGLENDINKKVSKYSLGMRQRLGIARALINDPNILLLDEPTNGLDPEGIKSLRELLIKLAKKGMGILVSSHNLSELDSFCNKVVMINNGKIIKIIDRYNKKEECDKYLFNVNNTNNIKIGKIINKYKFIYEGYRNEIPNIIKDLVNNNILIYEINKIEKSLEDEYLALMESKNDNIN